MRIWLGVKSGNPKSYTNGASVSRNVKLVFFSNLPCKRIRVLDIVRGYALESKGCDDLVLSLEKRYETQLQYPRHYKSPQLRLVNPLV